MEDLKKEIEYLKEIIELQRKVIEKLQLTPNYPQPYQPYPYIGDLPYQPMKIWYSAGVEDMNQPRRQG